ncbi:MAG: excinuclease ABC subunit UvrA [Desulfovibrionaceae bacterium]|nr:excinuclease ABC subunit UvrA [Desulfovibrionaceae bacterium]
MKQCIHIEHARQHNLRDVTIDIPRDELVVICGPSGSGKSTLAFDIVYAEGQRRYMESLSAYARQFLPQMDKPDVERIEGLSPSISLEQQGGVHNPRSTVATVTEIYDFLRVLFARLGTYFCPSCGEPITSVSVDEIIYDILAQPLGTRSILLAPLVTQQKGTHQELFAKIKADGFMRVRVDGSQCLLDQIPKLEKTKKHTIDLIVDRLVIKEGMRSRVADSVELALRYGEGRLFLNDPKTGRDVLFSTVAACPTCHISMPKPSPQLFSFNGPQGACPRCVGLGTVDAFEPRLIAPNMGLSLGERALLPWAGKGALDAYSMPLSALGRRFNFTLDTPLRAFTDEALAALWYGEDEDGRPRAGSAGLRRNWMGGTVALGARGDYQSAHFEFAQEAQDDISVSEERWPGVIPLLECGMQYGDKWREELGRYRSPRICPDCQGKRLCREALALKIDGLTIADLCDLPIDRELAWLSERTFSGRAATIFAPLAKELISRLTFLNEVGLSYLTLSRSMMTVSGGEAQRIRLASQLGSGLVGVCYVLDEPSIGLHPRDNERLLRTLRSLTDRGNSVLVVEHDAATICSADTVIEMGPGSGDHGGRVIFQGSVDCLLTEEDTLTARHLRGQETSPMPEERRSPKGWLTLAGVSTHNLKTIDCRFPLQVFTCVTGVSGSGKSSLVVETLYKHVALSLGLRVEHPGSLAGIHYEGAEPFERCIAIDQSPIGRTPRSNPATYTKIFDEIRAIFAETPDARRRGYTAGRFSFNVPGGRCEACKGEGQTRVEMHFLPDIFVTCDICKGMRYNHETLEVRYKGQNIAEVLNLTVEQAQALFSSYPSLSRKLSVLMDVGLGYIRLGQAGTTLSGGEAQRIKISRELGKNTLPGTLYILDEPTTGLHMHEVGKLISVLHALVERGATVVVIEHNTDMILAADYVLDLGPGGGESGGRIVSQGTPETLIADPASITGKFLLEERVNRTKRMQRYTRTES